MLEAKINNYFYSLEYIKGIDSDAGTSSGKEYSNTIEQSINAQLGVPFWDSFQINIILEQDLETQTYIDSPDEYNGYFLSQYYELTIAYVF